MAIQYLKKSPKTSSTDDSKTTGIVQDLLKELQKGETAKQFVEKAAGTDEIKWTSHSSSRASEFFVSHEL